MGVLTSRLFTDGDPAVVKRLEDCAMRIDTGPISLPTLGGQGAKFTVLTLCNGEKGAIKGKIGVQDLPSF